MKNISCEKIRFTLLSSKIFGRFLIKCNIRKLTKYTSQRWKGKSFEEEIQRCFTIFLDNEELQDTRLKRKLVVDIVWSYYRYGATPIEYFLMEFRNLKDLKRSSFLTNRYKDLIMITKVGLGDKWKLLEDKYIFYKNFKKFFYRDVLCLNKNSKEQEFLDFICRHQSFICKPIDGQCGAGIQIFQNIKKVDVAEFMNVHSNSLLEELIIQDDKMSEWNPTSVNTVRIPSFSNSTGFHILKPFMRVGRNGCIVDNAGNGGIFSNIDVKTGVICSNGWDEMGNEYIVHPDSKLRFLGWQIPRWNELLALVKEVHGSIPSYPYVGWDFALSKKGWVLVEGNWGQFVSEFVDKEGIKEQFDKLMEL